MKKIKTPINMQTLYEMTYVPDYWIEFDGNYKKTVQDIRLKDGTEILECWPNAGKFICLSCNNQGDTPISEVSHVRKHKEID